MMGNAEELVEVAGGASLEGLDQVFDSTGLTSEVPKGITNEFGTSFVKTRESSEGSKRSSLTGSEVVSQKAAEEIVDRLDQVVDDRVPTSEATQSSPREFGTIEAKRAEASEVDSLKAVEVITTEEAAKRLGISSRAVLNRIKSGSLHGKKIKGRFKEEWRVLWSLDQGGSEASEVYSEVTSEPISDEEIEDAGSEEGRQSQNIVFMSEQLRTLTEQTQVLSYRNGYLEAQLEASRSQLKLLPDFQSKASENESLKARIRELEEKLADRNLPWWQRMFGRK